MNEIAELLAGYYKTLAQNEAKRREGLDLHFDEMRANAATIRRIVEMLERAQVDAYTAGIKITEFTSAGENTAWLFRGGALVGVWNFDKEEILHWNPRMIFGWVGK